MKKNIYIAIVTLIALFVANSMNAQLDSTLTKCRSHIELPFISDGQTYTALLNGEESAEFYATFYGGTTYRIVGYSGKDAGNLIFSLYDQERNLIFSNSDFQNAEYWDFEFDNTLDCTIEAKLDTKYMASGFAVMLIGFKQ